jgi:hypothetical protein
MRINYTHRLGPGCSGVFDDFIVLIIIFPTKSIIMVDASGISRVVYVITDSHYDIFVSFSFTLALSVLDGLNDPLPT